MKTKFNSKSGLLYNPLLLVAFCILFSGGVFAQTFYHDYQDGRIYFKFKDNIEINYSVQADNSVDMTEIPFVASLQDEFLLKALTRPFYLNNDSKLLRTLMLEFEDFDKIDQIINRLSENPELEYVERVPYDRISYQPNDSLYSLYNGPNNWSWHLDRIKADSAWDITKGSSAIKLAIVDNAVWVDHPDLAGKVVAQRDTYYNTNNANPPSSGDPFAWSHGTHCAGLAAASSDNNIGVASIGYNVSIIAVKAAKNTDPEGIYGYPGIQWAANNGANIISMSWGGTGFSQTNQNLITSIYNMGIVLLAAAGNESTSAAHYPSSFNNVISVASTDGNDVKSDFSNFGTTVDVCAPGGVNAGGPSGLLSTTFSTATFGNYDLMAGTSMATPVASGLAGLILSMNPALTPSEVETIMETTSDDIYSLNPDYIGQLGAGRINAYKAVSNTPYFPTANLTTPITTILPGTGINFDDLSTGIPSQWQWTFEGGNPSASTDENPSGITYSTAGIYDVSLTVTNGFGSNTITLPDFITVTATPVPYISINVGETNPCIGNPVFFSDSSLYNPTSWEWWFSPSTVNFINGTASNSQNPVVSFAASGYYSVGLRAWNANGMADKTFENIIHVNGAVPNYAIDMEDGTSGYFMLWDTTKSQAKVDACAANNSNFGVHFHGDPTPTGWKGGPTSTTSSQAWDENNLFQSEAHICGVDASGIQFLNLSFDMRQTYSLGSRFSWFRVLVNGNPLPDNQGVIDFNPTTASDDPWKKLYFDLSLYAGSLFDITLQSVCRFSYLSQGAGDNVLIDNINITNTTTVDIPKSGESILSLFPSPSDGRFNVSVVPMNEQATIKVNSIIGNTVFTDMVYSKDGRIDKNLDLSFLPPGIYIMSVSGSKKLINTRFVIR